MSSTTISQNAFPKKVLIRRIFRKKIVNGVEVKEIVREEKVDSDGNVVEENPPSTVVEAKCTEVTQPKPTHIVKKIIRKIVKKPIAPPPKPPEETSTIVERKIITETGETKIVKVRVIRRIKSVQKDEKQSNICVNSGSINNTIKKIQTDEKVTDSQPNSFINDRNEVNKNLGSNTISYSESKKRKADNDMEKIPEKNQKIFHKNSASNQNFLINDFIGDKLSGSEDEEFPNIDEINDTVGEELTDSENENLPDQDRIHFVQGKYVSNHGEDYIVTNRTSSLTDIAHKSANVPDHPLSIDYGHGTTSSPNYDKSSEQNICAYDLRNTLSSREREDLVKEHNSAKEDSTPFQDIFGTESIGENFPLSTIGANKRHDHNFNLESNIDFSKDDPSKLLLTHQKEHEKLKIVYSAIMTAGDICKGSTFDEEINMHICSNEDVEIVESYTSHLIRKKKSLDKSKKYAHMIPFPFLYEGFNAMSLFYSLVDEICETNPTVTLSLIENKSLMFTSKYLTICVYGNDQDEIHNAVLAIENKFNSNFVILTRCLDETECLGKSGLFMKEFEIRGNINVLKFHLQMLRSLGLKIRYVVKYNKIEITSPTYFHFNYCINFIKCFLNGTTNETRSQNLEHPFSIVTFKQNKYKSSGQLFLENVSSKAVQLSCKSFQHPKGTHSSTFLLEVDKKLVETVSAVYSGKCIRGNGKYFFDLTNKKTTAYKYIRAIAEYLSQKHYGQIYCINQRLFIIECPTLKDDLNLPTFRFFRPNKITIMERRHMMLQYMITFDSAFMNTINLGPSFDTRVINMSGNRVDVKGHHSYYLTRSPQLIKSCQKNVILQNNYNKVLKFNVKSQKISQHKKFLGNLKVEIEKIMKSNLAKQDDIITYHCSPYKSKCNRQGFVFNHCLICVENLTSQLKDFPEGSEPYKKMKEILSSYCKKNDWENGEGKRDQPPLSGRGRRSRRKRGHFDKTEKKDPPDVDCFYVHVSASNEVLCLKYCDWISCFVNNQLMTGVMGFTVRQYTNFKITFTIPIEIYPEINWTQKFLCHPYFVGLSHLNEVLLMVHNRTDGSDEDTGIRLDKFLEGVSLENNSVKHVTVFTPNQHLLQQIQYNVKKIMKEIIEESKSDDIVHLEYKYNNNFRLKNIKTLKEVFSILGAQFGSYIRFEDSKPNVIMIDSYCQELAENAFFQIAEYVADLELNKGIEQLIYIPKMDCIRIVKLWHFVSNAQIPVVLGPNNINIEVIHANTGTDIKMLPMTGLVQISAASDYIADLAVKQLEKLAKKVAKDELYKQIESQLLWSKLLE